MSATRRQFLRAGVLGGAALALRVPVLLPEEARAGAGPAFAPNKWISIDGSGAVTLVASRAEMGQGVRTALAMILAEELEADWKTVTVITPSPGERYPGMRTGGSGSVSGYWMPLRKAGAAAREMLVAAAAEGWGVPAAECRAQAGAVVHGKSGRSLGYGALATKVAAAGRPVPKEPVLKPDSEFRLLGSRVPRVDGPAIVTGRAVYGLDARPLDGAALVAVVARCPVPGGRVRSFDGSRASAVPGVRRVLAISTGVAVVADDTWSALRGRDALRIDWDEGENRGGSTEAYWARLREASKGGRVTRSDGDVAKALSESARRLEATYDYEFQAHAPVEPMNCFADVRPGRCTIRVGTQAPNQAQEAAAKLLGVPLESVRVEVPLLGGGFGRRLDHDYVPEAVELSRTIAAPVQVVWTRQDEFEQDRFQPASTSTLAAGLDASGRLVAWRHKSTSFHLTQFGPFAPDDPDTYDGNPWGVLDNPYAVPNLVAEYAEAKAPVPTGSWRSVAYPSTVFARESFLDETAHAAGKDPVAWRLSLLEGGGVLRVGEWEIQRERLAAVLRLAATKSDWGAPLATIRSPGRRVGRGVAANVYHGRTHVAQVAEVSVGDAGDVRVHRVVCAVDCGRVVNLAGVEGQVESGIVWGLSAALNTQILFRDGRAQAKTFRDYPVLRLSETPAIAVHVVPSAEAPGGMGEPPVPPIAPAVANAVFAATGKRVRRLPIRPADLV
jgi:isoquinoline 1-oxidoreductase subunit beta